LGRRPPPFRDLAPLFETPPHVQANAHKPLPPFSRHRPLFKPTLDCPLPSVHVGRCGTLLCNSVVVLFVLLVCCSFVDLCICVCVCLSVCVPVYLCLFVCVFECICMFCWSVCLLCLFICSFLCLCVCLFVCLLD
jgi:hypothetical protein